MGGGGGMFIVPDDSTKKSQPKSTVLPKSLPSAEPITDVDALIARYAKATDEQRAKLDSEVTDLIEARVAKATALLTSGKKVGS